MAERRYTDPFAPKHVKGDFEGSAPVPGWVCSDCGAVVAHRGHHDRFHRIVTRGQPEALLDPLGEEF